MGPHGPWKTYIDQPPTLIISLIGAIASRTIIGYLYNNILITVYYGTSTASKVPATVYSPAVTTI